MLLLQRFQPPLYSHFAKCFLCSFFGFDRYLTRKYFTDTPINIRSTWLNLAVRLRPYQEKLIQLNNFVRVWHTWGGTCSIRRFFARKNVSGWEAKKSSKNFFSNPYISWKEWTLTAFFMAMWLRMCFVLVSIGLFLWFCESAVPVTVFRYMVRCKSYILVHASRPYVSCIASQAPKIFRFFSDEPMKHFLLKCLPSIRSKKK